MPQEVAYEKLALAMGYVQDTCHVYHHEHVALSIIPSNSDGMGFARRSSQVRAYLAAAAGFIASWRLDMLSWVGSERCRRHCSLSKAAKSNKW